MIKVIEKLPVPATYMGYTDWESSFLNSAFEKYFGYTKESNWSRGDLRKKLYPDPTYRAEVEEDIRKWEEVSPGDNRIVERKVTVGGRD